jgi:hypothetical protein
VSKFKGLVVQGVQEVQAGAMGAGTFRVQAFSVPQPMGLQPIR